MKFPDSRMCAHACIYVRSGDTPTETIEYHYYYGGIVLSSKSSTYSTMVLLVLTQGTLFLEMSLEKLTLYLVSRT